MLLIVVVAFWDAGWFDVTAAGSGSSSISSSRVQGEDEEVVQSGDGGCSSWLVRSMNLV